MKRTDILNIFILIVVALVLYYPIAYSNYLYTDEGVQLWHYKKDLAFSMFTTQGRAITEKLFSFLFSAIYKINELRYLRLFSLVGWIFCLPVWYYILSKILAKEKLPALLGFFTVLYLVTCPPFAISVYWASCIELFIANTCGLISGYMLYSAIKYEGNRTVVSEWSILFSVLFGVVALFTYQNGFGCFFIPFIIPACTQTSG